MNARGESRLRREIAIARKGWTADFPQAELPSEIGIQQPSSAPSIQSVEMAAGRKGSSQRVYMQSANSSV